METILLVASTVLFHSPLALYKDTLRRFQRMEQYNPDRAFNYELENSTLKEVSLSVILYYVSSFIFALFPLIGGFGIKWYFAIVINIVLSFFIIPFIAFAIYPTNSILNKKTLKIIGVFCIILAYIFWGFGMPNTI